jgi:hypothetical protein
MKAKALLLATILTSGLATSTSFAQVYSVNAVGYVNQYVPANGLNIVSVPLNGTDNNLNTTLPLPNGYDGTTIYRFDVPTQNYLDPISWIEGFGWFSASDPAPTVNPGEGIWVQNVASTRLDITFVGEVPMGTLQNVLPGGNNLKLLASMVPKDFKLSELCPRDGDTVYIWDPEKQKYKDPVAYIDGFGWFSANPDDPGPDGYTIPPAIGFWLQGTGAACVWTQTFSLN